MNNAQVFDEQNKWIMLAFNEPENNGIENFALLFGSGFYLGEE